MGLIGDAIESGSVVMRLEGERSLRSSREAVWRSLFESETLRSAIPGCESVTRVGETSYEAVVLVRVGPLKARFEGKAELSELDAPNGCVIRGEGSGGVAGFAKGEARLRLRDSADGGTILSFEAESRAGGKLAQIGQRLLQATAEKMATEFFDSLASHLDGEGADSESASELSSEGLVSMDEARRLATEAARAQFRSAALIMAAIASMSALALGVSFALLLQTF